MRCEVQGKALRWDPDIPYDLLAPSVDRIDPVQGYTPANTRIVSWGYNQLKNRHSDEAVEEWLEA